MAIIVDLDVFDMEFNTIIVVVPVSVQIGIDFTLETGAKGSYSFSDGTISGNVMLNPTIKLEAFGGVAASKFAGVGAYGNAALQIIYYLFGTEEGLRNMDLTGELGLKAYLGPFSYQRAFAHNTWHLYTANSVGTMFLMAAESGWTEGVNDAAQYAPADLSYLRDESGWLGAGGMSLMAAEAKTSFQSLITDTYRDARPVMISTGSGLYAAFVRANQDGQRYVAVTRSVDGRTWSEPVRADAGAILDSAPVLCADSSGKVWLAYARTASASENSLTAWAKSQEIVVGSIDPDTLKFTEGHTYGGTGYAHLQELAVINGNPALAWADSTVSDDNSVLQPAHTTIRCAVYANGKWGEAKDFYTLDAPINELRLGAFGAAVAVAYSSGSALYRVDDRGTPETLTENGDSVGYGVLPGENAPGFYWISDGTLVSERGTEIPVAGISHEFAVAGESIYYSMAENGSANLAVLKYDSGHWGQPIVLTGDSRYLENLSAARWNGNDYVLGMHTAVAITENRVDDAKNLVWSRIMPVSDLRLEDVSFDDSALAPGKPVPVTLTVTNAGDHPVSRIEANSNGGFKTVDCALLPGDSLEIESSVTCPNTLSVYSFSVAEAGQDDYTPEDNSQEVELGHADVTTELYYQQIGMSKALVAEVTNIGIEPAAGSVIIYDADGKEAAVSEFQNLAAGETAVAVYKLDSSFAGRYGGDVSASVVLNQKERYTLNNDATLYILEGNTEIKSLTPVGSGSVEAAVYCESGSEASAYCAFYTRAGQMLCVEIAPLTPGAENTLSFSAPGEDAAFAKVIILEKSCYPDCVSKDLRLI